MALCSSFGHDSPTVVDVSDSSGVVSPAEVGAMVVDWGWPMPLRST